MNIQLKIWDRINSKQNIATLMVALHLPILLSYPHAKIYQFTDTGLCEVAYEDTDHFRITKDFLNCYEKRIEQWLADDI